MGRILRWARRDKVIAAYLAGIIMAGVAIVVLLMLLINGQPQVTANSPTPTPLATTSPITSTLVPTATETFSPQVVAASTPTVSSLANQGKDVAPPPPPGLLAGSASNRPTATPGK